jgi:hypothetical protein
MVRVGAACSRDVWIRPAPCRHSGLDPESMFIGTRRRKTPRKGQNISGHLQPIDMDPGSIARGDELLRQPGFVRPHSVIPAEAEPAPDSIRGILLERTFSPPPGSRPFIGFPMRMHLPLACLKNSAPSSVPAIPKSLACPQPFKCWRYRGPDRCLIPAATACHPAPFQKSPETFASGGWTSEPSRRGFRPACPDRGRAQLIDPWFFPDTGNRKP